MSTCPRVCIFDIDNTLTVGALHDERVCPVVGNRSPSWPENGSGTTSAVLETISECIKNGYAIGVASNETRSQETNDTQTAFLKSLAPSIDDSFLKSPALQGAWSLLADADAETEIHSQDGGAFGVKQAMYLNILKHYAVPKACWRESIVFDDQMENLASAHSLGLRTFQASPECGGIYCEKGCGLPEGASAFVRMQSHASERI